MRIVTKAIMMSLKENKTVYGGEVLYKKLKHQNGIYAAYMFIHTAVKAGAVLINAGKCIIKRL